MIYFAVKKEPYSFTLAKLISLVFNTHGEKRMKEKGMQIKKVWDQKF